MTTTEKTRWRYLDKRPHPWREQLYIKGKKLRAFTVWMAMLTNQMTPEETAIDWDLPLEVVQEAIEYCESHRDLLASEAIEERQRLEEAGYSLEPKITH
jgi:uncharacterized protein (DUF433 family)